MREVKNIKMHTTFLYLSLILSLFTTQTQLLMACRSLNISRYRDTGFTHFPPGDWVNFCIGSIEHSLGNHQKHSKGIVLEICEDYQTEFSLHWNDAPPLGWGDTDHATQYGAYGMAAIFIELMTPFSIYNSHPKGDGFDFVVIRKSISPSEDEPIEEDEFNFAQKESRLIIDGRLEVSGTQDRTATNGRFNIKMNQTKVSDYSIKSPAIIVISDFETPKLKIGYREPVNA